MNGLLIAMHPLSSAPGLIAGATRRGHPHRTRRLGHDGQMPKIPDSTKATLHQRLIDRSRQRWPQLSQIRMRYRARLRLHRRRPGRRRGAAAVPAALRRLGTTMGLCDLPSQPRRLRRLVPAHRIHGRLTRRRPRHRLRPLPRRPHRLDLNPRRTYDRDH